VVPSEDGPVLECGVEVWEHELVQQLVAQYAGTPVDGS
jgi:hypothetical protein